jgi:hypothetical protein
VQLGGDEDGQRSVLAIEEVDRERRVWVVLAGPATRWRDRILRRGFETEESLSDLQLDAIRDAFLVLTSYEGTDDARDDHSGHLFRIPTRVLLGEAPPAPVPLGPPLRGFRAKPEGLAVEPSGTLIVVFDDDREGKHLFAGYEQSDGLFTVIDSRP